MPCRSYHLHTTRQANTILQTKQNKTKWNYPGFEFKHRQVHDSSQSNQGTDHLVSQLVLQVCKPKKILEVGNICFKDLNKANQAPNSRLRNFSRDFLTFGSFGNSIYSSILGDGVCTSMGWKSNIYSSDWNTANLVWYSDVFVIGNTKSLSGHLFWILLNQVIFATCKKL
jgi:hypothetical protein